MTEPRQPPIRADLSGSPRAGTLHLPPPRPAYEVRIERTGDTAARLTVSRGGVASHIALMLIPRHLTDDLVPVGEAWHGNGFIDLYEFRIHADPDMRSLTLHDDLPTQRTPRTIADVEAAAPALT